MRAWHCAVAAGFWIVLSATLVGAEFWETEPYTTWSPSQVQDLLTDSPWSHQVSIRTPIADGLAERVGGLNGGVVGAGVGSRGGVGSPGGGVAGDGAGNIGGGSFLAPPGRIRLTVRWASALPMRQAAARRAQLAADWQPLAEPTGIESYYRVAVAGIPGALVADVTGLNELLDVTRLRVGNRGERSPVDILIGYEEGLLVIEGYFSRADPIVATDREVEFVTEFGSTRIRRTFDLDEMTLNDRLAL